MVEFGPHPVLPAEDVPIVGSCTCYKCGYNLRGLRGDGLCPECGQAISSSLDPARLIHADPWRLRLVQVGFGGLAATPVAIGLGWWVLWMLSAVFGQLRGVGAVALGSYIICCLTLCGMRTFNTDTALSVHIFRRWLRLTTLILVVLVPLASWATLADATLIAISALTGILLTMIAATRALVHLARWLVVLADHKEMGGKIELLLPLHGIASAGSLVIWVGLGAWRVVTAPATLPSVTWVVGPACLLAPLMFAGFAFLAAFLLTAWGYCFAVAWRLQGPIRSAGNLHQ